jgi:hypothetical protein
MVNRFAQQVHALGQLWRWLVLRMRVGAIERTAPIAHTVDRTGEGFSHRNARLIVAAVNALPELLDEVERLREQKARVIQRLWSAVAAPSDDRECPFVLGNMLRRVEAMATEINTLRARVAELEKALGGLDAAVAESAPLAWAAAGDQAEAHAWEQRTASIREQAARALEKDKNE